MGAIDVLTRPFQRATPKTAAVLSGGGVRSAEVLDVVTPDQDRARNYSKLSIIASAYRTAARLAASCPPRVGWLHPNGSWRPEPGPGVSALDELTARHVLSLYRPSNGTQADLIYREHRLRDRVGELWRVQIQDAATGVWTWEVFDRPAIQRVNQDWFLVLLSPAGTVRDGTAYRVHRSQVQRVWMPDDTWQMHAHSPTFDVLTECEQLVALTRNTKRRLLSRLAGANWIWTPSEAHVDLAPELIQPGGPTTNIEKALHDAARRAATDTSDNTVDAVAPLHMWWSKELGPPLNGEMGEQIDPNAIEMRQELLQEIAQGLPYPTTLVVDGPGAGGNHWGDWLADEKNQQIIGANLGHIGEGWTIGQFRPTLTMLADADLIGFDPQIVRVEFDMTPITQDPDQTDTLLRLAERGIIGPTPVLKATGLTDTDLATDTERARMLEFVAAKQVAAPEGVSATRDQPPQQIPAKTATLRLPEIAAARLDRFGSLSRSLNTERARLRGELAAALGTAMREALRRAGVKVATKAQRKAASVQTAVRQASTSGVYPSALVATVGVETEELFHDAFTTATATAVGLVAASQARRRKMLADALKLDDEPDWTEPEEERRNILAGWLPLALTALAVTRLNGVESTSGEVPADPTIPWQVITGATRVMDGAQVRDGQVQPPERPVEGRTPDGWADPLVVDVMASQGAGPLYEWTVGEPDRPFLPHQDLAGLRFDDESMFDLLAKDPSDFPEGPAMWQPGDHDGCQCSTEVIWAPGMFPAPDTPEGFE